MRKALCLLALASLLSQGMFPGYAEQRPVQVVCGSVGIGGSALGNTVNIESVVCAIPPVKLDALIRDKTRDLQDLSSSQRQTITLLEEKLDLNQR